MQPSSPPSIPAGQSPGNQVPVPPPAELARLGVFERLSFEMVRGISRHGPKRVASVFLKYVGSAWVQYCTRFLTIVEGLEEMGIRPDDRVVMVSNHRSFFDFYLIMSELLGTLKLTHHIYFPVRADFFYESPVGVFINALIGGFAMYPPVFRQPEKRGFNRYSLDEAIALVRSPGVLMGFHPEGTRGKGPDPYTFLPAQPGVGEVCHKARPTLVIPVFINGLGNNIVTQVASNFDHTGQPIVMVFGKPLDLSSFYAQSARLATYKRLSDRLMEEIARLSVRERELRAEALQSWPRR